MAMFDEDETSTRLKSALDMSELRDPQGKGVEFEVDENHLNRNDQEDELDFRTFDKNQVVSNICLMSDNEEEEDEENTGSNLEYLTEMERLERRMLQIKNSDLTPNKDGGVLKQMKTPGVGNVVPDEALVKIHYNAFTDVGQPPFDSTRLRGQELSIRMGKGECIPGLELAVLSMKKHEVSRFLIRHEYAYGEMGCPPRIPASATLIFDIEVLHFVEQEGVDDYYSMSWEERRAKLNYGDIEKVVKAENAEAKEFFANKNYHKAFNKYRRSQVILEKYHLKSDEEERQWKQQLLKVYVNLAVCSQYLYQFGRTISYCNLALELDKNHVKAHYFKGKALHSLGSLEDALKSLKRARNLSPTSTTIADALKSLSKSIADHKLLEANMYKRMFSKPTSDPETPDTASGTKAPEDGVKEKNNDQSECSPEFKEIVKKNLENFQNDADMTEMPFPQRQMTPAEISCILEVADDLGMAVCSRGTGNALRHIVYKKDARPA